MCTTVKAPKPTPPTVKPPVYLSNPFLDGLGIGAEATGRNSLRIDPGSAVPTPGSVTRPVYPPSNPGGGYGGGLGIGGGTRRGGGGLRNNLGVGIAAGVLGLGNS